MKRRVSLLISFVLLMQVFACLPVMAEEGALINTVEPILGDDFIYADEMIGSVQVSDTTGHWEDFNTRKEVSSVMEKIRWNVFVPIAPDNPVISSVINATDYIEVIITPYASTTIDSIILKSANGYTVTYVRGQYYLLADNLVSGYNIIPRNINYLVSSDIAHLVEDKEDIEEVISSYLRHIFMETSSSADVEQIIDSASTIINISSTKNSRIYVSEEGEKILYIAEDGRMFVSGNIQIEIPTQPEDDENENDDEAEMPVEIICVGYEFLFPQEVVEIQVKAYQYEEYIVTPQYTNDYIVSYASLPYYVVDGDTHPVVQELRNDPTTMRIYYVYTDGTRSMQIYGADGTYAAWCNDAWYVGASDLINGQELFNQSSLAQKVTEGEDVLLGNKCFLFFEQYDLYCFKETAETAVQEIISNGREIVIEYYYYGLSYIYIYEDDMVVINHDGKIYSLVYVGQYINNDTGSEPETELETEFDTEPMTDPEVESETEPEPEPETEPETEAVTDTEIESETVAETEPEIEPDTEVVTDPEVESETVAETEPETEPDTEVVTEPEVESETVAETEPDTEPDTEVVTEPEVESETVAETEPEIEPDTEVVTDPEIESETVAETEHEIELDTEVVTDPEIEPDTESDTTLGTEPETEPDTGSNTNPETTPVVKPKPTPVGKRFSFKRPMPILEYMPVLEIEPLEFLIVKPPFYKNRFFNFKFEEFINYIRRVSNN